MDDMKGLSDLINNLSQEDIRSLQGMAQSLFGGQGQPGGQAEPPSAQQPQAGGGGGVDLPGMLSGLDPGMMKKLSAVMGAMNGQGNDARSAFIAALKPLLSPERRHKADEAMRMIRLLELLPALRDQEVL
ncbi:MAG TPA: hypothetical protein IAD07_00075 [Candidatus Fimivicinus intestinavium]|nr:hypothetical protein [Candidatus Fimivicinus intestinavium]